MFFKIILPNMRKEPDCSDSFPILSRENYNPETIHSTTNIFSPTETLSVSLIYTSFTTPSIGVRISFSIFMATNTQSGSPALTSSPTLTYTFWITPGIWACMT